MAKFAGDVICSVQRQRSLRAFASLPSAFLALNQRVPADGAIKLTDACEARLPVTSPRMAVGRSVFINRVAQRAISRRWRFVVARSATYSTTQSRRKVKRNDATSAATPTR